MQECLDLSNESNKVVAFLGKPRRAGPKRPAPSLDFLTRTKAIALRSPPSGRTFWLPQSPGGIIQRLLNRAPSFVDGSQQGRNDPTIVRKSGFSKIG